MPILFHGLNDFTNLINYWLFWCHLRFLLNEKVTINALRIHILIARTLARRCPPLLSDLLRGWNYPGLVMDWNACVLGMSLMDM